MMLGLSLCVAAGPSGAVGSSGLGVPSNALTYNNEPLTYNGEYLTYTP